MFRTAPVHLRKTHAAHNVHPLCMSIQHANPYYHAKNFLSNDKGLREMNFVQEQQTVSKIELMRGIQSWGLFMYDVVILSLTKSEPPPSKNHYSVFSTTLSSNFCLAFPLLVMNCLICDSNIWRDLRNMCMRGGT